MFIIIIDTSGKEGYAALFQEKTLINIHTFSSTNQTKFLLPSIDDLLNKSNLSLSDIKTLAVCTGPGSFTGTRIGVICAKTLSFALNIPIIGFESTHNTPQKAIETILTSNTTTHKELEIQYHNM